MEELSMQSVEPHVADLFSNMIQSMNDYDSRHVEKISFFLLVNSNF